MSEQRQRLTGRILIGMAAGITVGLGFNLAGTGSALSTFVVDGVFHVGGQIFLASLKLLVVPLVLVSIVCGVASLDDLSRLGRVGGKTLGLYLMTTAIAISLALSAAMLVQPGAGFDLEAPSFAAKEPPSVVDTLINLFPSNPIQAMADGEMLQIIVFASLFGIAMTLSGDPGKRVLAFFQDLNEVILRLVMLLISLAPYGVFCLLGKVFAAEGLAAIRPLGWYFGLVLAVLFTHALFTYPLLVRTLARLNPVVFLRKMRAPLALAFSTASSGATIPVTLETVERRLGVNNSIGSFTVPLGATINMDGTAIMQGVATGFIAQAYGIPLGPGDFLSVVLTATLASIGTAAVPGVGLVMLAMVLRQVNLPVEGIGLIIGVDRLLDMVRTAVNVTGDAAVTCVVANSEGQLDRDVFRDPQAGADPA
ncbi:MAG: dicarboxylate/amino acid:cation symporter [Myxococcota bacterium]